jgi:type I restriction enzyme M protein
MVAISGNFFYTVTLPCTLWFLDKSKLGTAREDQVLFIDARHIFRQIDRAHRDFTPAQMEFISNIVRLYRGGQPEFTDGSEAKLKEVFGSEPSYADTLGLCKLASRDSIKAQGWSLNPGRYVGAIKGKDLSDEDFKEQFEALTEELLVLNSEAYELEEIIAANAAEILEQS